MTTTAIATKQRVLQQIPRAHDVLNEDIARTTAERDALRRFRAQCAQIDPTTPDPTPAPQTKNTTTGLTRLTAMIGSTNQNQQPRSNGLLQRVRDAYRETVMAIPHYDEEYDEPLDVNLAAEVGDDLANAITQGGAFPPQIKQSLDQAIRQCIASRDVFLDDLDHEQEALDTAETTITTILDWLREQNERPMSEWSLTERYRIHATLCAHEAECDAVAHARQETIQTHRVRAGQTGTDADADSPWLIVYLYQSLPVTYPVLADLATVGELLREARGRLERTLTPCFAD